MFPVSSKSNSISFNDTNTQPYEHQELADILNRHTFENGRCYLNADIVLTACKALNIDAKYYAGWVFLKGSMPIHHAWVVIEGKHVVDMSVNIAQMEMLAKIDTSKPNWRYTARDNIRAMPKIPNSEACVFGFLPEGYEYIGSPDRADDARARFRHMRNSFPDHPSYAHRGGDMHDRSTLQKMLLEE